MTAPSTEEERHVAMGAMATATAPEVLTIRGLGSCIALALHDPLARVAGLAHTVIPRPLDRPLPGPAWASSEAVHRLVDLMDSAGARPSRLSARIAGGSSLFPDRKKALDVGEANARSVTQELAALGIPLLSRQVGGPYSRTVHLHPANGRFEVTSRAATSLPALARHRPPSRERGPQVAQALLEAAVTPLARLLERPVLVERPHLYTPSWDELVPFLGGAGTPVWWAVAWLRSPRGDGVLGLALPAQHALGMHAILERLVPTQAPPWDVVGEVGNMMSSHATTALASFLGGPLRQEPLLSQVQPADAAARALRARMVVPPLALHGRLHAEAAFRGVDFALLVAGWRDALAESPPAGRPRRSAAPGQA